MKEVIVILIILAIILVAYFVFWLIDFMKARESKKILKNNTAQLNRLVEQVRQEQEKEVFRKNIPEVLRAVRSSYLSCGVFLSVGGECCEKYKCKKKNGRYRSGSNGADAPYAGGCVCRACIRRRAERIHI